MQRFTNKDKNLILESNGKCSCSTSIRFAAERLVHTKIKKINQENPTAADRKIPTAKI